MNSSNKSLEHNGPKANAKHADFALFLHGADILLRPENTTARKHIEENVAKYAQWLVKFYRHDGSFFLLRKQNTDGYFVKPGADLATLAAALVQCGFVVVKEDERRPTFARLTVGNGSERRWLLHLSNYIIPPKLVKLIVKGAGSPN